MSGMLNAGSASPHPMSTKKTADQWFAEYGESHQDHTNETIHWICLPIIFYTVAGLIWSIPTPAAFANGPMLNWATIAMALVFLFYVRLSISLAVGMLVFMAAVVAVLAWQARVCPFAIWKSSLILFVLAWIGQFIGHKIEGKKPSFFKDVQFLLIGPAWLMHFIYRKLGIGY
jgi:uncharacterized membrane protein YGL010W